MILESEKNFVRLPDEFKFLLNNKKEASKKSLIKSLLIKIFLLEKSQSARKIYNQLTKLVAI